MADDTPMPKPVLITLPPNEILINVTGALNGHVDHLSQEINAFTTCNEAISHVQKILSNHDRPLMLTHIPTRQQRKKLKELAQSTYEPAEASGPLKVLNAIPADQLPKPKTATSKERQVLKESFSTALNPDEPFLTTIAPLEESRLPAISGYVKLSAFDGLGTDPVVEIRDDHCIWDTGSHYCTVTSDLVDPSFLALAAHDPYRAPSGIGVQVDACFSLSNTTFEISTIFVIRPPSSMPNNRSGILLGQHAFMDRMVVESVPRSILLKRGHQVEETIWGEIRIKAALNLDDELQELA